MVIRGVILFIAATTAFPFIPRRIYNAAPGNLKLPFAIIGDMDARSKQGSLWYSPMTIGTLSLDANKTLASVQWSFSFNYTSALNYDNRGMEMSDLRYFNGKLITVDDKTGVLYRLQGNQAIPWVILADGDGSMPNPFKGEWLTVKHGFLYCGGQGRERIAPTGAYLNSNPMYVKRISRDGVVVSEDWIQRYISLRAAIQIRYPGYVIHEAVQWSDVHKRWFFLPRHLSKLAYNPDTVDESGANVLLSASEDFKNFTAIMIGREVRTRGFSAFQFVQGTNDTIIVAVKSQEHGEQPFSSYMMVFTIHGRIIMDETLIPGQIKYEGIELLSEEDYKHFMALSPRVG